ncbi:F0F1 ATP synthase subunit delta [Jatrophihabitans sp.]|uniref:F0F1 ATP synthase subunit delta n=1 Tax=Jatrophihabitans sp. TaxID=1932789 RepID=UPI002BF5009A|nr:F0F1 ATP synthase subunit delta [Jatrophihabitans sp.]
MTSAASRAALAELRERLNAMLPQLSDSRFSWLPLVGGHAGNRYQELAGELYAAAGLLAGQPRLRRALGDPSTDASARGELARTLFTGKVGDVALDLIADAVSLRWSSPWDLPDALEIIADDTLLAAAEQDGQLDTVEDELFRFERILANSGELTAALDEAGMPAERRVALLDSLVGQKVHPITRQLLEHAVTSGRRPTLLLAIDDLLQASAARRERSVARVLSAAELTSEQTERLAAALSRLYGREINVRTAVDDSVQGGLVVRVGDEVIDGSVASRLAAARAAFAG